MATAGESASTFKTPLQPLKSAVSRADSTEECPQCFSRCGGAAAGEGGGVEFLPGDGGGSLVSDTGGHVNSVPAVRQTTNRGLTI